MERVNKCGNLKTETQNDLHRNIMTDALNGWTRVDDGEMFAFDLFQNTLPYLPITSITK